MNLTLRPYLLTPQERTETIRTINDLTINHPSLVNHGYRVMAATAQPCAGGGRINVKVNVIVDRTPREHADIGDAPAIDLPTAVVAKHIYLSLLSTRDALQTDRFSFGEPMLSEQLIVDENLERAFAVLAEACNCTTAYLGLVQDTVAFAKLAWQKFWGSKPKRGSGIQESAAIALILPTTPKTPGRWRHNSAEDLLRLALLGTRARDRDIDPLANPDRAWEWASGRLGVALPEFDTAMHTRPFREARLAALDAIAPLGEFDAVAAADRVLLAHGGYRDLVPSVYSRLLEAMVGPAAPAPAAEPAEPEGDEFLL